MPNIFLETHLPRYQAEGYKYLAGIPEVRRFLTTEIFETIKLARKHLFANGIIVLEFDVVAKDLMPHPRARLLENGLVRRNNLLHGGLLKDGIRLTLRFFAARLQIVLNFRS